MAAESFFQFRHEKLANSSCIPLGWNCIILNDAIGQTSNNVEKISNRASDILRVPIEISNKLVTNIRFYTTNPTTLNNWNFIQPTDTIIQSFWYQEAMNKKMDRNSWYAIEDETKNNFTYLSLVRFRFVP